MDFRSIIAGYASNGTALNGQQRNEKNLTTEDLLFFLRPCLLSSATAASVYSWTALKTSHAFASFCRPGLVRVVPRFRGARVRYTFIRTGVSHRGYPVGPRFLARRSLSDRYLRSFRFAIAHYSGQNNQAQKITKATTFARFQGKNSATTTTVMTAIKGCRPTVIHPSFPRRSPRLLTVVIDLSASAYQQIISCSNNC